MDQPNPELVVRGVARVVGARSLQGWAYFEGSDAVPIIVVRSGQRVVAECKANLVRSDLMEEGIHPTGRCGFLIELTDIDQLESDRNITVTVQQTGARLRIEGRKDEHPIILKRAADSLLVFVHVPKTAGTSFRLAAEQYFGRSHVETDYGEHDTATSQTVRETVYSGQIDMLREALRNNETHMFSGHFPIVKYLQFLLKTSAGVPSCASRFSA